MKWLGNFFALIVFFVSGIQDAQADVPKCVPLENAETLAALQKNPGLFVTSKVSSEEIALFLTSTSKYLTEQKCELQKNPFFSLPDFNMEPHACESANRACTLIAAQSHAYTESDAALNFFAEHCPSGTHVSDAYFFKLFGDSFSYAAKEFNSLTQNSELQTQCCGQDGVCKKKWSETRLQILLGLGTLANSQFNIKSASVQISPAQISGCLTEGCIKRIFLHELGHACQYSKAAQANGSPDARAFTLTGMHNDMVRFLGKDAVNCLEHNFEIEYEHEEKSIRDKINVQHWMEEAYADTVFVNEWDTSALASACNSLENIEHASPRSYLSCMLKYESKLKSRFCTGVKQ